MRYSIKMLVKKVLNKIRGNTISQSLRRYKKRFLKYAFTDCKCEYPQQFEASIIRLYHTIEKGLSYENYRPGFGKDNVDKLIASLEQYASRGFNISEFFYETALSCLNAYVQKNREHGFIDDNLNQRIESLQGKANDKGGVIVISRPIDTDKMNFEQLLKTRHSIRHFSDKAVDVKLINEAVELAQNTPSACNRQGWRTRIIADKTVVEKVLANQNGNRGFGQEIDKLLLVTADLRAQQKSREYFQAFIDGGMYAENVINALHFKGIASVPLSASLTDEQERNVRKILGIDDAEVLILFIGVGNYPEGSFVSVRSERKGVRKE